MIEILPKINSDRIRKSTKEFSQKGGIIQRLETIRRIILAKRDQLATEYSKPPIRRIIRNSRRREFWINSKPPIRRIICKVFN